MVWLIEEKFKVNEYITLKLENNNTFVCINGENLRKDLNNRKQIDSLRKDKNNNVLSDWNLIFDRKRK